MSDFRPLSAQFSVAPQIGITDVAEAKAQGFAMVINNRPDGEEPAAPQGDEIAHACAAEGLAYAAIPIGRSGFSHAQIDALDRCSRHLEQMLEQLEADSRTNYLRLLCATLASSNPRQACAHAASCADEPAGELCAATAAFAAIPAAKPLA